MSSSFSPYALEQKVNNCDVVSVDVSVSPCRGLCRGLCQALHLISEFNFLQDCVRVCSLRILDSKSNCLASCASGTKFEKQKQQGPQHPHKVTTGPALFSCSKACCPLTAPPPPSSSLLRTHQNFLGPAPDPRRPEAFDVTPWLAASPKCRC